MLCFAVVLAFDAITRLEFTDGVLMLFILDVWIGVPVKISGLVDIGGLMVIVSCLILPSPPCMGCHIYLLKRSLSSSAA